MFNTLITWIRRLDPASEYGFEFHPLCDDFSCRQMFDERLQGAKNGCYLVTACHGDAVIAAYGRKALAVEHLAWSKAVSRRPGRIISHNGWRLRLWARRLVDRWRGGLGQTRSFPDETARRLGGGFFRVARPADGPWARFSRARGGRLSAPSPGAPIETRWAAGSGRADEISTRSRRRRLAPAWPGLLSLGAPLPIVSCHPARQPAARVPLRRRARRLR